MQRGIEPDIKGFVGPVVLQGTSTERFRFQYRGKGRYGMT